MRRVLSAVLLSAVITVLSIAPAFAHTGFESSNPPDGAVVDEPLDRIELVFSGEAAPAGDGFVVLDPSGTVLEPDRVSSADGLVWVLEFDEPLAGGVAGVRWSVAAPDAHPIEGSFSFTVPPLEDAPEIVAPPSGTPEEPADLASFLDAGADRAVFADGSGVLARSLGLLGAMVAMGGIVFAAVVMRGSERDIRGVLFWVRRGAVLLGLGASLEFIHQLAVINGDWLTLWPPGSLGTVVTSPLGLAIGLRIVGAGLMLRAHLDVVEATAVVDPVMAVHAAAPYRSGLTA